MCLVHNTTYSEDIVDKHLNGTLFILAVVVIRDKFHINW